MAPCSLNPHLAQHISLIINGWIPHDNVESNSNLHYCVLHNLLSCCTKIVHELFMWKWKEKWLMSAEMNVKRNCEYLDQCKYCGHYWRLNLVWGGCTQLCLLSFLLFFCVLICSVFSFLLFLFVPCRKDPHASLRSPSCSWRESSCRPD